MADEKSTGQVSSVVHCERRKGIPECCDCELPVQIATSFSPENRGKKFYACPLNQSVGPAQGCGFGKWWEEAVGEQLKIIENDKSQLDEYLMEVEQRFSKLETKYEELEARLAELGI